VVPGSDRTRNGPRSSNPSAESVLVADYEWDAFGLPERRTDWYVRRLKIEHRQIGPGRRQAGSE
jgi:hypothetical protein